MKKRLLAVCLLSVSVPVFAQSKFTYSVPKDIILGSAALGVGLVPFALHNEPDTIPDRQNADAVNPFDRPFMAPYNRTLDVFSDYGVYSMLLLPVLSVAPNFRDAGTLLTYGIMYAEAFLLTAGTKNALKGAIIRYRPYVYTTGIPSGREDDYYNSFPSGSTAYAFLGAGFLSATYAYEFPESRWKIPIITGSYTLAVGIASMRIISGSHFLSDVLTGAAIGSLYGWLIPILHQKQSPESPLSVLLSTNSVIISVKL
jgi:undecaprenyl-diphosphatase